MVFLVYGLGTTPNHILLKCGCVKRKITKEGLSINLENHTLEYSKAYVPRLIAYLDWTHVLEWYVIGCGSKNIYQKKCIQRILNYMLKR